ncbi:LacI family DNA-binding transcriptional regulator [Streptomyces venetus]
MARTGRGGSHPAPPSGADVAGAAGVSQKTVSRVFNGELGYRMGLPPYGT